jgi:hypothetical protein
MPPCPWDHRLISLLVTWACALIMLILFAIMAGVPFLFWK